MEFGGHKNLWEKLMKELASCGYNPESIKVDLSENLVKHISLIKRNAYLLVVDTDNLAIVGSENLEIKTKAELVRRLEQLKHYQEMGEVLWSLPNLVLSWTSSN